MIEKNHFLDGDQTWRDCSFPQGKIFSPLGNGKSCDVIRWRYKSDFRLEKSSKFRLYLTPNASSSVCQSLRISTRLGMEIHDTYDHVIGKLKNFKLFPGPNHEVKKLKKGWKWSFWHSKARAKSNHQRNKLKRRTLCYLTSWSNMLRNTQTLVFSFSK